MTDSSSVANPAMTLAAPALMRRLPDPAADSSARGWGWGKSLMTLGAMSALAVGVLFWNAPGPQEFQARAQAQASRVVDELGHVLAAIGEDGPAKPVRLDEVSPWLVQALIATEDKRFMEHHGVDLYRVAAASWGWLAGRREGASTITQQLARNLFPNEVGQERSLARKVREAVVAVKLEWYYSKRQILTLYLNHVRFARGLVGVEAASEHYFNRSAQDLDPAQASLLVVMLKGPSSYEPESHPKMALARRNLVLAQMASEGTLGGSLLHWYQGMPLRVRPALGGLPDPTAKVAPPTPAVPASEQAWQRVQTLVQQWARFKGVDLSQGGYTIQTDSTMPGEVLAVRDRAGHVVATGKDLRMFTGPVAKTGADGVEGLS